MVKKLYCPECKSKNIEPSWGSEGYMQCNKCGHEWIQYAQRKPKISIAEQSWRFGYKMNLKRARTGTKADKDHFKKIYGIDWKKAKLNKYPKFKR